jgi:cell wall-associated NlpC family hydrolase
MPGMTRAGFALLCALMVMSTPAVGADPLKTMRAYCRADGLGDRLQPSTWIKIAPLVTWKIEPAWDQLRLIRGYEIGTPQLGEDGVEVQVTYTVSGDLQAGKVSREIRLESRTYQLATEDEGQHWRIVGPPSIPYLFESQADIEGLSALLKPDDGSYISSSAFVWHLLRRDHPDLPYRDTASLAKANYLVETDEPKPGDVALYYDGDVPFHVGVVDADGSIVSATMNAGVWRGGPESFPGIVQYRRIDTDTIGNTAERSPLPAAVGTPEPEQSPGTTSPGNETQ